MRIERVVHVHGLGLLVVAIDRAGVYLREPRQRRETALELSWLRAHGVASRDRAEQMKRERAQRRALRRIGGAR